MVLLALATVCGAISQLPYCGESGLTLTLLADALSLVGLVQALRGYKTPLPLVSRIPLCRGMRFFVGASF